MHGPKPLRRYRLSGADQAFGGDPVLPRELLATLRREGEIAAAVRVACAIRLRAARRRQRDLATRQLEHALRDGLEQFARDEQRLLGEVRQLIDALATERESLRLRAESLTWDLAQVALRLLLADPPADVAVRSSVALALAERAGLAFAGPAVVHVHPDDIVRVPPPAPDAGWTLAADDSLTPGQSRLSHAGGQVSADYVTNVDAILRALVATLDTHTVPETPSGLEEHRIHPISRSAE